MNNFSKSIIAICALIALVTVIYFGWLKTHSEKISDKNWKTATDMKTGIVFDYPETLLTQYIHPLEWPPKVQWTHEVFTCAEKRMVDDRTYCITKQSEGAAGSIYTTYTYAHPLKENGTIIMTFTLQAVQCANYDDPQKSACERERETFSMDSIVDRIVQGVRIE